MAPTTTTKFGLLKPQVGGDNNAWGSTLNSTLDQIDQLLGVTGTPIVADVVARDLLFPAPSLDAVAIVKALGYQMRFGTPATGANKWLPEGVTRAAGPVITSNSRGAVGDGVADDASFLARADTDTVASGGRHELDLSALPVRCYINSNLTLNAHFRPNNGAAKIYVGAGKTLTINGHFDPGLYSVFDPTMPGRVVFGALHEHNAEWFGVVGDGIVDDTPALNWLTSVNGPIPDNSRVYFTLCRQLTLISGEWLVMSRTGLELVAAQTTIPNALGAKITWMGPPPVIGSDLSVNNGSKIVTTAVGQFTAAMVGRRLIAHGVLGANSIIASYQSSTQVTLTDNVRTTGGGKPYLIGGVLVAMLSCDHCKIIGFGLRQTSFDAVQGLSGYIAVGTKILHSVNVNDTFNNAWVGRAILVEGAGPGGTDLISKIISVDSGTQVTLNDNAGTNIASTALTRYVIGPNATSLPARKGIVLDLTTTDGNQYTSSGTRCSVIECQSNTPLNLDWDVVSIADTTDSNQEYHQILDCQLYGSSTGHFVASGTWSTNIGAGTATRTFGGGQAWVGMRIRIPNAGPAGGVLDTKLISTADGQTFVLKDVPTAAVVGVTANIYESRGRCVRIGPSFNAKRIAVRRCHLNFALAGIYQESGSVLLDEISCSNNEMDWFHNDSSEPSLSIEHNTETALQCLNKVGGNAVTMMSPRFGNAWPLANAPYISVAGSVIIKGHVFDNQAGLDGRTIFGCTTGFACLHLEGGEYNTAGQTMAQVFGNFLTPNVGGSLVLFGEDERCNITDLIFRTGCFVGQAPLGNQQITQLGVKGFTYFGKSGQGLIDSTLALYNILGGSLPAIRGSVENQGGNSNGDATFVAGGVEGAFGQIGINFSGLETAALVARMPTAAGFAADATKDLHGLLVTSPSATLNATNAPWYGIRIKKQSQVNVNNPHGLWQEDVGDPNLLAGLTSFGSGRVEKATVYIDIGAGGNATPNPAGSETYRYRIAGAATVNAPSNPQKGMVFKLIIFNNTAGPITPTLNAVFLGAGFGAIGAGKSRSRTYVYDDVLTKWEPVGAVSEDF